MKAVDLTKYKEQSTKRKTLMEPEIARRCSVCGASIRQRAAFCPQCGQAISKEPDPQSAETQAFDPAKTRTDFEAAQTLAPDPAKIEPVRTTEPVAAAPVSVSRATLGSTADNVRDRVEKIKKVSHIVLDQAAYDPSVRFLLVAAAFFVLFLALLIFSKLIG